MSSCVEKRCMKLCSVIFYSAFQNACAVSVDCTSIYLFVKAKFLKCIKNSLNYKERILNNSTFHLTLGGVQHLPVMYKKY